MLSPHEIATLLLAAASLGPIDADALEPPDLAALEQARLVHVNVDQGQAKVIVTEDGHRVLRRLGLERSVGERAELARLTIAQRADRETGNGVSGRSAPTEAAAGETAREWQQAAALPANASERREEQA
ncbi:hypothetical protein PHO31112_05116 [Pandoraea horticolens]|uniref:Uncharacterized protein n=1 Tax=Pandoraea horticolens TaxID=2508298 RepID=A0A5E4Z6K4_9BURK|nr:hypothetical protein [Pandoraea horticolens]VVE56766.1 hypothetical protein PHO31112_05116 [Pandoraea horticolens]